MLFVLETIAKMKTGIWWLNYWNSVQCRSCRVSSQWTSLKLTSLHMSITTRT